MEKIRFCVLLKDGRIATEETSWVEPLDQLIESSAVELGWIDLQSPYAVDLEDIQGKFGFHPHAIEDCRRFDQRAKLEEFKDHWFWVFHGSSLNSKNEVELQELHAFLAGNWLVTVHQGEIDPVNRLHDEWWRVGSPRPKTPLKTWAILVSGLVDQHAQTLAKIIDLFEELDDEIAVRLKTGQIERIHGLKMGLKSIRRVVGPQIEYMRAVLEGRMSVSTAHEDLLDLRAVKDPLQVLIEKLDLVLEKTLSLRDSYAVAATLASNRSMARLTTASVVFLPITFVTGFFGMNFQGLPVNDLRWLWSVIAFCIFAPLAVLYWIRRNDLRS